MTRLEQLRIDHGLTARGLATEVGVAPMTVLRIESGENANAPTLKKLADFFGVPASTLTRPAVFAPFPEGEEAA